MGYRDGWRSHVRRAPPYLRAHAGANLGVAATLAMGIAATAVMFDVVSRLLLSPPSSVRAPDRVGRLYVTQRLGGAVQTFGSISYPQYAALRTAGGAVGAIAASSEAEVRIGSPIAGETGTASLVTGPYFDVLGVRPAIGRFFGVEVDGPSGDRSVVVLSDAIWRRRFGASRGIIGRTVRIEGNPFVVVGVAPAGFSGGGVRRLAVWVPLGALAAWQVGDRWATNQQAYWLQVVARMPPGGSPQRASEQATSILRAITERPSGPDPALRAVFRSLAGLREPDGTLSRTDRVSGWLSAVSVLLLLVATANVASYLLMRSAQRRRDTAIRIALGSGRWRIARDVLRESAVLALLSGALALLLAWGGSHALRALVLPDLVPAVSTLSARTGLVTLGLAAGVGVATGIPLLVQWHRTDAARELTGLRAGVSPRTSRVQRALLVGQIAIAAILLTGAGLFVQSVDRIGHVNLGFEPANVLVVRMEHGAPDDSAPTARTDGVLRLVQQMRGVASASLATTTPFSLSISTSINVPGRGTTDVGVDGPYVNYVSPDFFRTLRVSIMAGRPFQGTDGPGAPPVVMINRTLARRLWPDGSAIGQCIVVGSGPACSHVVGVVGDARQQRLDEALPMQVYLPIAQRQGPGVGGGTLLIRTSIPSPALIPRVREAILAFEPAVSQVTVEPLDAAIAPQRRPWQLGALVFGSFGILALAVASAGVYTLVASRVQQRTAEIGVRLAVGATPWGIFWLVLQEAVHLAAYGGLIALGAWLVSGSRLTSLLFETSPYDVRVFATVTLVLLATTVVASVTSARRAAQLNPSELLRDE